MPSGAGGNGRSVDLDEQLAGLHAGRVRVVATAAVAQALLPPAMRKLLTSTRA